MSGLEKGFAEKIATIGRFEKKPHIAVAVSGGADSMALCFLLKKWCDVNKGSLTALTIDHGLRVESADEAAWVAKTLAKYGICHHTLKWQGHKPGGAIQEKARLARYELLEKWCHDNAVLHLFVAHHRGDQEETFWQRLSHGSDVPGLAGMAEISELAHIRIIRPLLGFDRADIENWLKKNKLKWINDPSNDNSKYQRVRFRKLLHEEGLNNQRFGLLNSKFAAIRALLDNNLAVSMAANIIINGDSSVAVNLYNFNSMDVWLRQAILARAITTISGKSDAPRTESIVRLDTDISGTGFKSATLHRCLIKKQRGRLLISVEKPHMSVSPKRSLTEGRVFKSNENG